MTPVERRILIKVSTMYYLEHMKQTEIAKRLGVERTTVSKHLKRALDQGIVTITVANEKFEDIEAAMEKRFGLKECFIVPRSLDLLAVKRNEVRINLRNFGILRVTGKFANRRAPSKPDNLFVRDNSAKKLQTCAPH